MMLPVCISFVAMKLARRWKRDFEASSPASLPKSCDRDKGAGNRTVHTDLHRIDYRNPLSTMAALDRRVQAIYDALDNRLPKVTSINSIRSL